MKVLSNNVVGWECRDQSDLQMFQVESFLNLHPILYFFIFWGGNLSRLVYLFREFLLSQINLKYSLVDYFYLDLWSLSM